MLGLQPLQPLRLIRTRQLRLGLFRQGQEVLRVHAPDLFGFPALLEFLAGVLVDGFEHHEPGLALRPFLLPYEALVQEGGDALEGVYGQISCRVADGLHGLEGAAPGEDGHPGEERLLAFVEQRVAPLYGPT